MNDSARIDPQAVLDKELGFLRSAFANNKNIEEIIAAIRERLQVGVIADAVNGPGGNFLTEHDVHAVVVDMYMELDEIRRGGKEISSWDGRSATSTVTRLPTSLGISRVTPKEAFRHLIWHNIENGLGSKTLPYPNGIPTEDDIERLLASIDTAKAQQAASQSPQPSHPFSLPSAVGQLVAGLGDGIKHLVGGAQHVDPSEPLSGSPGEGQKSWREKVGRTDPTLVGGSAIGALGGLATTAVGLSHLRDPGTGKIRFGGVVTALVGATLTGVAAYKFLQGYDKGPGVSV
jgi:hypothetical protein